MSDLAIKREPLTYNEFSRTSYFKDIALARNGDNAAEARLQQHAQEMRKVIPAREAAAERRALGDGPDGLEFEYRVNPSRVDGQGGYFTAPLWLIDRFAGAPRTGRVLSALIPNLPLPQAASEVKLPRITTGTRTMPQSADGGAVSSRDIVDAASSQPVTTIAGMSDISLQLLEQSPAGAHMDWVIFKDLRASYDGQLETALIAGSGVGNVFQGILNLPTGAGGVNAVTFTSASPTAALYATAMAQAAGQIGDTRFLPPEVTLMRTARWAWYGSGDTNISSGPQRFLGWPVQPDDAIPATFGGSGPTNGTQDAAVLMRPSDSILLETVQRTDVKLEPLSGEMMARLTLHGYATAIHRLPTGIATITGTGMTVQSGY